MKEFFKSLILDREELARKLSSELLSAKERDKIKSQIEMLDIQIEKGNYRLRIIKKRDSTGLSIRRASILALENALLSENPDRSYFTLNSIRKRALLVYTLLNRDITKLISVYHLHPMDPLSFSEKEEFSLSGYRRTIYFLVLNEWWLMQNKKMEDSFRRIYNEIKL